MVITARFASTCPRCNNPIAVGAQVNWERGSKATHTVCPAARPASAAPVAPRNRFLTAADIGSYVYDSTGIDNGSVFHVVETRGTKRFYAEKWVAIGGQRTVESGRLVQHGDWQFESSDGRRYSGLVAQLLDAGRLRRMTADEVIDFATLTGRCVQHGGFLTDATSVDAGIGPVCAAKLGIDRKALAEAARRRRAALHTPAEPAPSEPAAPAVDREARYRELFGDDDEPAAPATIQPADDTERLAARQRWADGSLPTGGYNIRRRRQYGRARAAQPVATVGRWSRPSDDDLGHAAGLGADTDDYAF